MEIALTTTTPSTTWPPNLRRAEASRYLNEQYGIELATATLAKMFSTRSDGSPAYRAGRVPLYPRDELDAWAARRLGEETRLTPRKDQTTMQKLISRAPRHKARAQSLPLFEVLERRRWDDAPR